MATYLIHLVASTLASLSSRADQQRTPPPVWNFEFPTLGIRIALRDQLEERDSLKLHTGLALICEVAASNQEEGFLRARTIAEGIASLVSFASMTSVGACQTRSVIEVNPSGNGHRYRQFLYLTEGIPPGSLKVIDEMQFRRIWKQFNDHPEQQRLARALAWLSKGFGMENSFDEFMAYWIGLEVLRGILRRNLLKKEKDKWDGVRAEFPGEPNLPTFDQVKELRDEMLHGYKELDHHLLQRVKQSVDPCKKVLITAIGKILNLPEADVRDVCAQSLRRARVRPYFVMEGAMDGPVQFEDALGTYPSVSIEITEKPKYALTSRGSISINIKPKCTFSCKPEVRFHARAMEYWGDPDSAIEGAEIHPPES